MSLHVLKSKTENKYVTQDYVMGTGKNVKVVYKLKKKKINNQHQNSLRFFLMEFIVSVSFSTSTTFYLHSSITLYFNDRSMSIC